MVRFGSSRNLAHCLVLLHGLGKASVQRLGKESRESLHVPSGLHSMDGWTLVCMYVCMYMIYDDYFLLHLLLILSLSRSTRHHLFHSSTYQMSESKVDLDGSLDNRRNDDNLVTQGGPLHPWIGKLSFWLSEASVVGIALGYCLAASLLSIINKWAIMKFPFPGLLTALQYFVSAMGVYLLGKLGFLEHDKLDPKIMLKFLPAAFCFYLSIFTNSELLLHANVDTFIVFRSAVPILVAVGETFYLKQPVPSSKTWLSLVVIFIGAVIYVLTDREFTLDAYTWALAYLASMSIDFVYIKHIVMTIGLNTWGLVLYNNLEALLLFPLELLIMGEGSQLSREKLHHSIDWASFDVWLPVGLSCLFGLAISFFGFSCRRGISATGFTVLGVVNKLLTVIINLIIWDKHASWAGTIGLLTCIGGGILYQQSTTKPKGAPPPVPAEIEVEEQPLMKNEQENQN